jgi:hypothetical protein
MRYPERSRASELASALSIDVGAMIDPQHEDAVLLIVDLVDDSVRTTSGGPEPFKFALERMTNAVGVLAQRPKHELNDGRSDPARQPGQLSLGRCGDG